MLLDERFDHTAFFLVHICKGYFYINVSPRFCFVWLYQSEQWLQHWSGQSSKVMFDIFITELLALTREARVPSVNIGRQKSAIIATQYLTCLSDGETYVILALNKGVVGPGRVTWHWLPACVIRLWYMSQRISFGTQSIPRITQKVPNKYEFVACGLWSPLMSVPCDTCFGPWSALE